MRAALAKTERAKLASILALLASDQQGKRDAAAHAATRLLKRRGLAWIDILEPTIEKPLPHFGTWRATCAKLLEQRGSLRAWEIAFLTDLPGFRRLSTKQRYVLKEIADRVLGKDVQ